MRVTTNSATRLRRTHLRNLALSVTAVTLASSLTACGTEDVPTCAEFAQMNPETGLFVELNSEQVSALSASLRSEGFDDGPYNRAIGHSEVVAYCNIYDGVANANQDQPISNAH